MNIFRKNKTTGFFQSVIAVTVLTFFLFLCSFACAANNRPIPSDTDHSADPGSVSSTEQQEIQSGPEVFDLEFAPVAMGIPDEKQQAYMNYMIRAPRI
jgi:hypothetical protein